MVLIWYRPNGTSLKGFIGNVQDNVLDLFHTATSEIYSYESYDYHNIFSFNSQLFKG